MKNDKLRLDVMVLLLCLATAGAALAVRPWVFRWEKDIEIKKEVSHYWEVRETIQKCSLCGAAGRNAALQYAALYPQAA